MIGNRIFELRMAANLSQEELAEIIYVSEKTILDWETNRAIPDLIQSGRLAKALNLKCIDELLESSSIDNEKWFKTIEFAKERIKPKINPVSYSTWFENLNFVKYDKGTIILSVTTPLNARMLNTLNTGYKEKLLNEIENIGDHVNDIKVVVEE